MAQSKYYASVELDMLVADLENEIYNMENDPNIQEDDPKLIRLCAEYDKYWDERSHLQNLKMRAKHRQEEQLANY